MELNWSTFILEIINFLVLVWILKRFLYQPVLDIIARRRAGIDQTLADAKTKLTEAEQLQAQYEGRLTEWDKERQQAREALSLDVEAERARKMAELQTALEQEQEKTRVAEARRQTDALHEMEEMALIQGAQFATRLLEQGAGPETEARLVELVIEELSQLPEERLASLRNSFSPPPDSIKVSSAFPLSDTQRQRLDQALHNITASKLSVQYAQDSSLLAGLRITIGAWLLASNLRDELQGFVELAHVE